MLGTYIGHGLGLGPINLGSSDIVSTTLDLVGYIQKGDNLCYFEGDMKVNIVQGDDVGLALSVYDLNDQEISYEDITDIEWVLVDPYDQVALRKSFGDGIDITDNIKLSLGSLDTMLLKGDYVHEFTITLSGTDVSTVVQNYKLLPSRFYVRGKVV